MHKHRGAIIEQVYGITANAVTVLAADHAGAGPIGAYDAAGAAAPHRTALPVTGDAVAWLAACQSTNQWVVGADAR